MAILDLHQTIRMPTDVSYFRIPIRCRSQRSWAITGQLPGPCRERGVFDTHQRRRSSLATNLNAAWTQTFWSRPPASTVPAASSTQREAKQMPSAKVSRPSRERMFTGSRGAERLPRRWNPRGADILYGVAAIQRMPDVLSAVIANVQWP